MSLEKESVGLLRKALDTMEQGFRDLPSFETSLDLAAVEKTLLETAERMQDNYPYHHPLYAGQMLKPPHPVARLAYMMSMWLNPNNHALDGGRASSAMEKEAVATLAEMIGWDRHLGHLTSGGTMANLEGLWIAGSLQKNDQVIVASKQAHYTHERICGVLRLPFASIPTDSSARMDTEALKQTLDEKDVGTVVVTMGSTATGSVDPLLRILELREEYGFRIHADAAYGGYFTLIDNLEPTTRAEYDHLSEADSVVIDPHKHGLQPYGCGCILFKDPTVGKIYKHDSPYTYFSSTDLHLGEISLECSRPGASAVALWATQRLLPPERGGIFAESLRKCRHAAVELYERISADNRFVPLMKPELDIVVWAVRADSAVGASNAAQQIFEAAANEDLHLAVANMPRSLIQKSLPDMQWDREHVACLRSCLMKPEHFDRIDEIWERLDRAATKVLTL
jgi:glutamate/tyrosine decarboxylase-like PLP-dependent enzyme